MNQRVNEAVWEMPEQSVASYVQAVMECYRQHINPSLAALMQFMGFDSVEVAAEGCVVRDAHGREFLDCLGGFGVMTLGHRHPRVVAAVKEQLDKVPLSSRVLFNEPQARLAERLAQVTPGALQCCFFCNSGAEAIEGALKIARLATGRTHFVAAQNAFHGKTLGALSASGRAVYKQPFQPLVPGFTHVPFGDAQAIADALTEDTAAVLLEPIQGEAGVIVPPDGYLREVESLCRQRGVLLIADEIQTGLARTGKMFAVEHEGVCPDLMCLAKALGGGVMPIGAIVGTADIWKCLEPNPLLHSSTFGGNPLACAAGVATLEVLTTENFPEKAATRGAQLMNALQAVQSDFPDAIAAVRGKGLLIGVEFTDEDIAGLVIAGLAQRHIIAAYTLNNPKVIRFEPPLLITEEQIATVAAAFREAVQQTMALVADL
ncbi:MAG: aminotransferase class III-fold pyridoxal phosphate-dependent enzyme [Abditibacteriales bacterium]|nr:aminotransferase class III-fold pyridoxal phosphate-dependent enzyme [Abditibacteriales bacterium]MDW8364513.1 aminotransferase class III-fold pyridoxal phosphate-dependent enzyme [Abditibacteriales bacterium]